MKKAIIHTLFVLSVAALSLSCGGGKKKPATDAEATGTRAAKQLVVSISDSLIMNRGADTINFGRVREGEHVVREFKIRNAGDKAAVITKLDLSCGCIEAEYPKQPLKPGQEGEMKLTLDTRNLGGWIFKTAIMQTSLSSKPYILYVTAEIE